MKKKVNILSYSFDSSEPKTKYPINYEEKPWKLPRERDGDGDMLSVNNIISMEIKKLKIFVTSSNS